MEKPSSCSACNDPTTANRFFFSRGEPERGDGLLKRLLNKLKHYRLGVTDRLGENFKLDFPSLPSTHTLAGVHGNNVQPAMEEMFVQRISSMAYDGLNDYELRKNLTSASFHLEGKRKKAFFLQPGNRQVSEKPVDGWPLPLGPPSASSARSSGEKAGKRLKRSRPGRAREGRPWVVNTRPPASL